MSISEEVRARITTIVSSDRIVLFMKGDRNNPQCGFSATVIGVLNDLGCDYNTHNVLADPEVRQGIKVFSDWQTIPQLYVDGEFQGGCDIVQEMFAKGELHQAIGQEKPEPVIPTIEISPSASAAFAAALEDAEEPFLRLEVNARFEHNLFFSEGKQGDIEAVVKGELTVPLVVDPMSARRADGLKLDYQDGPGGTGFKLDNPNAPPAVKPMTAKELKARLDEGESLDIIDVRGDDERAYAALSMASNFDAESRGRLEQTAKDAPVVFFCHTGNRSMTVAQQYLSAGHTNVYNLSGGINAWSRDVDSTVPTY